MTSDQASSALTSVIGEMQTLRGPASFTSSGRDKFPFSHKQVAGWHTFAPHDTEQKQECNHSTPYGFNNIIDTHATLCRQTKNVSGMSASPAVFLQVGEAGGTHFWRAMVTEDEETQRGRRNGYWDKTVSNVLYAQLPEQYATFNAMRQIHGIDCGTEQTLRDLGVFLSSRVHQSLMDRRSKITCHPVVDADEALLRRYMPGTIGSIDDGPRLSSSVTASVPPYCRQITQGYRSVSSRPTIDVMYTQLYGESDAPTCETFVALPYKREDFKLVPPELLEMVKGEGPLGRKWSEAMQRGSDAFKSYQQSCVSRKMTALESGLLRTYNVDPIKATEAARRDFMVASLQTVIDDGIRSGTLVSSASETLPVIRVRGMILTESDDESLHETGLVRPAQLQTPSNGSMSTIQAVITQNEEAESKRRRRELTRQESLDQAHAHRWEEAARKAEIARLEQELRLLSLQNQLAGVRGPLPGYSDGPAVRSGDLSIESQSGTTREEEKGSVRKDWEPTGAAASSYGQASSLTQEGILEPGGLSRSFRGEKRAYQDEKPNTPSENMTGSRQSRHRRKRGSGQDNKSKCAVM